MTNTTPPDPDEPARTGTWTLRLRTLSGEPGSQRRTLVRNGAWEWSAFFAYAVAMFFLSPFIVSRLGDSAYGMWELILAVTGYLSLADLGVRPAVVHFVAKHDALDDVRALNRYVNTACVTFMAGAVAVLAVAIPIAFWLPAGFGTAEGFRTEATLALIITAAELAVTLPLNAFSAVAIGKQRYDLYGRARLVVLAVRTGLIVFVLSQGWGLVALACVNAGASLIEILWFTRTAFRLQPGLRFAPSLADREAAGKLLRFGGWAIVVMFAVQVTWATDAVVIGGHLGDVHVAWFAIGAKLALYAREFLRVGMRVLEPATGAMEARGDVDGIRRLLANGMRFMVLLSAPVIVYLLVVGPAFLGRWMGTPYRDASSDVLIWMTIAVLPTIASYPLVSLHYGTNRLRPLALLLLAEAVGNLVLSLVLVRTMGIPGVALGTAIPAWLVHGVLLPRLVCVRFGIPWAALMGRTWTGPVIAGALTWFALRLLVAPGADLGWGLLFALAGASVVLYGATVYLLVRIARPLWGVGPILARAPQTEADA